jgi:hypothetical protein
MNSPKKVLKSGGPKNPDKKKTELSDTEEPISPIIDDEDDFDLPIDHEIAHFDDFEDDDDDF